MKFNAVHLIALLLVSLIVSCTSHVQLSDLILKNEKAVFSIYTYNEDGSPVATATGFFIDSKGIGITNYHVLEGAYRAKIKLDNGRKYDLKRVLSFNSNTDLAEFSISIPHDTLFSYLTLSDKLPLKGEEIFVIGNPEGLESSVSKGIVSSLREFGRKDTVIQITAPISHGSSGSPIMTMEGNVVGIASFDYIEGQNLNFGIEATKIDDLLKNSNKKTPSDLIEDGLIGNIKSIIEYHYDVLPDISEYNAKERYMLHKIYEESPPEGNLSSTYRTDYNENGDSIHRSYWNNLETQEINDEIRPGKNVYKLDSVNHLIEKKYYDYKKNLSRRTIYRYDSLGNLEMELFYDVTKYASLGEILSFARNHPAKNDLTDEQIEEKLKNPEKLKILWEALYQDDYNVPTPDEFLFYYYPSKRATTKDSIGILFSYCIFKYNDKGKVIQENKFDIEDSLISQKLFHYDDLGRLIETMQYECLEIIDFRKSSSSDMVFYYQLGSSLKSNRNVYGRREVYLFDSTGSLINNNGNMVEEVDFNEDGIISMLQRFKNFDSKGNWLSCIYYDEKNKPYSIVKREIEYY
jgi:hypothetical protein